MQGNPDIDILMMPTSKAIKKHVKDRDAITEIYNRAYEAVIIIMEVKDTDINKLKAERNELAKAVGLMTTLKPTMVVDSAHPVEMALEVSEYITQHIAELARRDASLLTEGEQKEILSYIRGNYDRDKIPTWLLDLIDGIARRDEKIAELQFKLDSLCPCKT